jgi:hypothetical protein
MFQFNRYKIKLSTGEVIGFMEIDYDVIKHVANEPDIKDILAACTKILHHELQDAKIGNDRELKKRLSTPPIGCLMKFRNFECKDKSDCSMFDKYKCSLGALDLKKKRGLFPDCFNFSSENAEVSHLGSLIINAWKDDYNVIIVNC